MLGEKKQNQQIDSQNNERLLRLLESWLTYQHSSFFFLSQQYIRKYN